MRKKELEKLACRPAGKKIIDLACQPGIEGDRYDGTPHKYRYRYLSKIENTDGIVKVAVFYAPEIRKQIFDPCYEIFIDVKNEKWLSREKCQDGTWEWRTAMISNLLKWEWWDHDIYCWMSTPEGKRLQSLLKTKKEGINAISEWQGRIKEKENLEKYRRETEAWDDDMKLVRKEPKGFWEWWKKHAFSGENYIFYDYEKPHPKVGFCTVCQKMVPLNAIPEHKALGWCSVCREDITYVARKKRRNPMYTSIRSISLIQNYGEGIIKRTYSVRRIDNPLVMGNTKYTVNETMRTIIVNGSVKKYVYMDYKRRGNRWTQEKSTQLMVGHSFLQGKIYPDNLLYVMSKLHTSYSIAKRAGIGDAGTFLCKEQAYPIIEKVFKAGLINLGKDMVVLSWNISTGTGGELAKQLKIDSARMKRLKELNGGCYMLEWLKKEKGENIRYSDNVLQIMSLNKSGPDNYVVKELRKYLSIEKICNYVRKQAELKYPEKPEDYLKDRIIQQIFRDWYDYLNMMEMQKSDMTKEILLKPKNLTQAHNELVYQRSKPFQEKEISNIKEKFPAVDEVCKSIKRYEYSDEQYCIVAPKGVEDIFREGTILKHCIHTCDIYFNRIEKRETYLIFLRRASEPEMPWYTLEVEPGGNIRQKKSVLNEAYSDLDGAMPFLRKWQQYVQQHMSKEDKRLAELSDEARRTGYKQLRKEKKVVWHGRLKGKLLADALESDFLAAN